MRKLFVLLFVCLSQISLLAAHDIKDTTEDFYTKGYNDAYTRGIYDQSYNLSKVNRKLRNHFQRNSLTKKDLDLLENATDYNEGFSNGLEEKYKPKNHTLKIDKDPLGGIEGAFTDSIISTPTDTSSSK